MKPQPINPLTRLMLLAAAAAAASSPLVAAKINAPTAQHSYNSDGDEYSSHRMLPNSPQNSCGSDWNDAIQCGVRCPGGTNAECPEGKQCFADVDCPLPPTISPKPTRQPVPSFAIGNHDKQVIGYYASWQWYDRAKLAKPSNMDFSKVTRVNYAFFQLDEDGNIWGTDEWADPRLLYGDLNPGTCSSGQPLCRCSWIGAQEKSCAYHNDPTGLIWQVHHARAEIYPSIGGWTLSDAFPGMSADPVSRVIFARNCRQLIVDYGFDGIDLDWEYPGYAAHSGTPNDTVNFNLLLKAIREELDDLGDETGRFYGLTAALPCGPSNIANIDIEEVSKYLTEFNLMSYDFHGAWDATTGTNSPLYDQASDPEPGWSVDGCVNSWVARGAPKEKLNIGLGFYGRSFKDAKELGVTHGGTDEHAWEIDEGTPQWFNLMERFDEMTYVWDEETSTPIAYFDDNKGGLVSYDDERSICMKTEYAIEESLHGFIIWELSGDVMDDLTTPLLDIVNRKLSETDTNCADPFGPKLNQPTQPDATSSTQATTTAASTTQQATTVATTTQATTSSSSTTPSTEANVSAMKIDALADSDMKNQPEDNDKEDGESLTKKQKKHQKKQDKQGNKKQQQEKQQNKKQNQEGKKQQNKQQNQQSTSSTEDNKASLLAIKIDALADSAVKNLPLTEDKEDGESQTKKQKKQEKKKQTQQKKKQKQQKKQQKQQNKPLQKEQFSATVTLIPAPAVKPEKTKEKDEGGPWADVMQTVIDASGRRKVVRNKSQPKKPYRPPKAN